jgi:hypothetical protein
MNGILLDLNSTYGSTFRAAMSSRPSPERPDRRRCALVNRSTSKTPKEPRLPPHSTLCDADALACSDLPTSVKRSIGVALAHAYLAIEQTLKGLGRVALDEAGARARVDAAPETLTEAYQTVLRAAGVDDPYEKLRAASRGRSLALSELHAWVEALDLPADIKRRLVALRPSDYVGLAAVLARRAVDDARAWVKA